MIPAGCVAACPGCDQRALDAAAGLAQKRDWLARALAPWRARLAAPVAATQRWGYRDRAVLAAAWQDGRWVFGLRRREAVVPIPACPLHTPRVNAVVAALAACLPEPRAAPLACLVLNGGQAALVSRAPLADAPAWPGDALAAAGLDGLWLNVHPSSGRRLFAKRGWRLLWGAPWSRDPAGLLHGPQSFLQVQPALHARALDAAAAHLAPGPGAGVIDLYCGIGHGLRRWSAAGARVLGIELGGEAVACAHDNAPAATGLRGACATRVPQLRAWRAAAADGARLLYANPPRTGLEAEVTRWIVDDDRPARVAYLSCSAGTLHRDLVALEAGGYAVTAIVPYDFFPQTRHVETLVTLRRDPHL